MDCNSHGKVVMEDLNKHYSMMQAGWNVLFNVLAVHPPVCRGRGLSLRTLVQQGSPSGLASTNVASQVDHVALGH